MSRGIDRTVRLLEPSKKVNDVASPTQPFKSHLNTNHIVLLGDPGSGKTHIFKEASQFPNAKYMTVRGFLALKGKDCSDKILFLDGLDEFRSRSDGHNIILSVIQLLHKIDCKSLRLSCRVADWFGETDLLVVCHFSRHGFDE